MPYGSKENVEKRPERTQRYVRTYRRHSTPIPCGSAKAGDGRETAGSLGETEASWRRAHSDRRFMIEGGIARIVAMIGAQKCG